MFVYCNNNPIIYSDPTGYVLRADSEFLGRVFSEEEGYNQRILALAYSVTNIEIRKIDGTNYWTHDASIGADWFAQYAETEYKLVKSVQLYSKYLYERIEGMERIEKNRKYVEMSKGHIFSETMVHLEPYFDYAARIRVGFLFEKTKEVNLNVDESRWYVRAMMITWGYDGREVYK